MFCIKLFIIFTTHLLFIPSDVDGGGDGKGPVKLSLEDEVDTTLAWAFILGDPDRYIHPKDRLFNQKCDEIRGKKSMERLGEIKKYFGEKYSTNKVLLKLLQINVNQGAMVEFCNKITGGDKQFYKEFNTKIDSLSKVREMMLNVSMEAKRDSSTIKIPQFLCYLKLYKTRTLEVFKTNNVKDFVMKYMVIFEDLITGLAKETNTTPSKDCRPDVVPKPPGLPPQALMLAIVEAINGLTKK